MRLRGTLIENPTDMTAASPYGGTELGFTPLMAYRPNPKTPIQIAEEFGGMIVEAAYMGLSAVLVGILRTWDNDALTRIFPNTIEGTKTGDRVVSYQAFGSSAQPGDLASDRSIGLLFAPAAEEFHPFIYFYRALPLVEKTAEIRLNMVDDFGIAFAFRAIPDSNGKVIDKGRKRDIVIT